MRCIALGCLVPAILAAQSTPFHAGMTVTRSLRVAPGRYVAPAGDSAALIIRGDNITVDLTGVTLVGDTDHPHPDRFTGIAIRIDVGRNVTVRGARIRGYKTGILARRVTRLSLIDNDLSYNWRPRLYSGIEKESLIDWLDYHNNEHDEWLRYGAGIYLADVTVAEIKGNTVRDGMDGLMMVRTTGARVWNNDFSYNSGVGVGLYRSSRNYIMHNRIDWNVRGYADGFYNRGQDSAGLLMYEQSCNNVVAYNSVTHSGDGLFIWAGQSTMDNGAGGVNDNLVYHNDFSFAPTNGMEATFSRNAFVDNRVEGSWHGLWGGYSYGSVVLGNHFAHNQEAISIEHGQDNRIAGNTFDGDTVAIHLWWNPVTASPDFDYPAHRDTRSHNYTVLGNTFLHNRVALWAVNTQALRATGNRVTDVDTAVKLSGDSSGSSIDLRSTMPAPVPIPAGDRVPPLPGGIDPLTDPAIRAPRSAIVVDRYGPYDGKRPLLWPVGRDDGDTVRLRVLGPRGKWRVVKRDGMASLSRDAGATGDTITAVVSPDAQQVSIELEYRGAPVVTEFGDQIGAGRPVRFGWSRFDPRVEWHLAFFPWDTRRKTVDGPPPLDSIASHTPIATLDTNRLDLTWYGPPRKTIPQANVLTVATAVLHLAPGRYRLRTISDDAAVVAINGAIVLDDWAPGESHLKDAAFVATGSDTVRVVHLQLDGWYELRVDIVPER